jgi:hypothetical protein
MSEPQPGANSTAAEDTAALRRSFSLALNDAMKEPKVSASVLEVVRKFLADCESDRRWTAEQALMSAPPTTEAATPPAVVTGLPFSAPARATEDHPSGPDESERSFASVSPRLAEEALLPFQSS